VAYFHSFYDFLFIIWLQKYGKTPTFAPHSFINWIEIIEKRLFSIALCLTFILSATSVSAQDAAYREALSKMLEASGAMTTVKSNPETGCLLSPIIAPRSSSRIHPEHSNKYVSSSRSFAEIHLFNWIEIMKKRLFSIALCLTFILSATSVSAQDASDNCSSKFFQNSSGTFE